MGKAAGVVTIRMKAGVSELFTDIAQAKAKIIDFGAESEKVNSKIGGSVKKVGEAVGEAGAHAVSSMSAASGAIRLFEGNVTHNIRAVERFAATTLGLGPILQAAFPVVGAVSLLGVLGMMGTEVVNFFKKIANAPEAIKGAFRGLEGSLRTTNDELRVSNDRLENDIAKLEGKRQNTLKLALDEARLAADKLAQSLEKDLEAIGKLLTENEVGLMMAAFSGQASTKDIRQQFGGETGHGGFIGRIEAINDAGANSFSSVTTKDQRDAARAAWNTNLVEEYRAELRLVNQEYSKTLAAARAIREVNKELGGSSEKTAEDARAEQLGAMRRTLQSMIARVPLAAGNEDLTEKKQNLMAANDAAKLERPFENAKKRMDAQISELRSKLSEIGRTTAFKVMADSAGEAVKEIERINEHLEKLHRGPLTQVERIEIISRAQTEAKLKAETQWGAAMQATQTTIDERIASLKLMADAIGEGYEAAKKASVETSVMGAMKEKFSDPVFAKDRAKLTGQFGSAYDADQSLQSKKAVDSIETQIEMENAMAVAQFRGAEAVRQATLAFRLNEIAKSKDKDAAIALMEAEMNLYNAQNANIGAEASAKMREKIQASQNMTAAILQGAEAQRKASLEAKYAEMERARPGSSDDARKLDEIDHQNAIAEAALKTGMQYRTQLESIDQQIAKLKEIRGIQGATLEINISLRNLENERIHALAQQALQMRGARDGVRAFFLEMQTDAKSAAQIVYESLNNSLDRVTDQMAKFVTGQKTSWADMFKGIGESLVKDTLKSQIQKGLGAIGAAFGIDIGGGGKLDGQSEAKAQWVRMAGTPGGGSGGALGLAIGQGGGSGGPGLFSGSDFGSMIFHALGGMAEGGAVAPGAAYMVGERGPEIFSPSAAGSITSNAAARRVLGSGGATYSYAIDARGAALGAENRVARAIEASHSSAISNSIRANAERTKRTPQKN